MSAVWLIPLVAAAAGVLALLRAALTTAEEAAALARSLARLGELRPVMSQVRDETMALRAASQGLRRR